jgi:hypothetical protein
MCLAVESGRSRRRTLDPNGPENFDSVRAKQVRSSEKKILVSRWGRSQHNKIAASHAASEIMRTIDQAIRVTVGRTGWATSLDPGEQLWGAALVVDEQGHATVFDRDGGVDAAGRTGPDFRSRPGTSE